jgi:predicted enzyme related to lactoylglutathione lyase
MNRVVHFEIHANDPPRARAFYQAMFGWRFDQYGDMDYWLIYTGPPEQPGINGGLHKHVGAHDGDAVASFVCTVDVDNLDTMIARTRSSGGSCVVQKKAIPRVGWFAYCKDTEGNIFGLIQNDQKAK